VHTPLQTTKELEQKYADKAAAAKSKKPEWGHERDRQVRLVHNHPTYAGMVEQMDTAVGMVLDKLEKLGLADSTIVVFTSDNGGLSTSEGSPTSNVPLRAGKGWLYEGGIRVASIVRWPGATKAGSTCDTPITANDYFPTLVAAVGGELKPELRIDGVDITPLLRGETIAERPIFWHYPHYGNQGGRPGGAVRDGRWKLVDWYEDEPLELYDLQSDPTESHNVATEHADVTGRLGKLLENWRQEVGAKMPTPNPRFRSDRRDRGT
jgi:arylsulfatase A-like enzyme